VNPLNMSRSRESSLFACAYICIGNQDNDECNSLMTLINEGSKTERFRRDWMVACAPAHSTLRRHRIGNTWPHGGGYISRTVQPVDV
jgi:hypothetical protein